VQSSRILAVLALAVLALGACNAGHLGGPPPPNASPGIVSFRLLLPSTRSFCDQQPYCGAPFPYHISFATESGEPLPPTTTGWCPQDCSNPSPCPLIPEIPCIEAPTGIAVTKVEGSWDGGYVEWTTYRDGTSCYTGKYVLPGRYVAWLCATPGTITETDAGPDGGAPTPTCTATGPQECVQVPFNIPGPSPIEVALPPPPEGG
jgi:hypothetical protein